MLSIKLKGSAVISTRASSTQVNLGHETLLVEHEPIIFCPPCTTQAIFRPLNFNQAIVSTLCSTRMDGPPLMIIHSQSAQGSINKSNALSFPFQAVTCTRHDHIRSSD